jgi:hypothetical protein
LISQVNTKRQVVDSKQGVRKPTITSTREAIRVALRLG